MGIPTSMGANKLELRQGDVHTTPNGVGVLDATVLANAGGELDAVVAGAVLSKTSAGALVPGILAAVAAGGGPLPLFLNFGHDVNTLPASVRTRGMPAFGSLPAGGNPFWDLPAAAIGSESGPYSYIIGGSGVELTSTRIDTSATFDKAGILLTAVSATAATVADRGKIRAAETVGTDVIIGITTGPKFTSPDGYDTLPFMAIFRPGTTVPDTITSGD